MITTEEQKPQGLISEIQRHEAAPQKLENLFSKAELDEIRSIRQEAYQDKSRCSTKLIANSSKPLGHTAHPGPELKKRLENIVRPKLSSHCPEKFEMDFAFHRNLFPYGIHTDSGYDPQEMIYKQGIIPLDVFPNDGEVYTVIFDQKCYHSISYPRKLETIKSLTPEELKQVKDWNSEKTKNEWYKYWEKNEDQFENFNGLSIALPFKWKAGNMALWDRAHLHCSSDFSVHKIEGKSGLMWISRKV